MTQLGAGPSPFAVMKAGGNGVGSGGNGVKWIVFFFFLGGVKGGVFFVFFFVLVLVWWRSEWWRSLGVDFEG